MPVELSDLEIARQAKVQPVTEIADLLAIPRHNLLQYGHHKAKLSLDYIHALADKPDSKLILVAGMTPTRAGEGKTTTSVGLADALRRLGKMSSVCLREPSLGPCFGMKGGAAGGGYAQVVPMEDINLHFTGDFHAIAAAHNLLASLIDNHIYWGNTLDIDLRRISWRRVVDVNDRSLREITVGLGGVNNGYPHSSGFDITAASEVMAILCLATSLDDLRQRLGNIIVAQRRDLSPVYARELGAQGAMTALLKDALQPNLVQTLEGTPAFIHGGPFADIAHGCNSVIATSTALKLTDYVVTEAGFGADLGAEKFFDIKMRQSGLTPDLVVIVATLRAIKMHVGRQAGKCENEAELISRGFANLARHVDNMRYFGLPVLVAINRFALDDVDELQQLQELCRNKGVKAVLCDHWARGGAGAEDLARQVLDTLQQQKAAFRFLYENDLSLWEKVRTIAQSLYGAEDIIANQKIRDQFRELQQQGYGHFPVCIAKTPLSFSTDPDLKGAPSGHVVPIRELRLATGAGFLVVICGDVMTMPGLPREPSAQRIDINPDGLIEGLF